MPTEFIYVMWVDIRTNSDYFPTHHNFLVLLGAFAKLRKATISFIMFVGLSACPSVRMEKLGPHWTDLLQI